MYGKTKKIIIVLFLTVAALSVMCSCTDGEDEPEEVQFASYEPSLQPAAKNIRQFADSTENTPEYRISVKDIGDIKIRLFPEEAPCACGRFEKLADDGYYEGKPFGRIIDDYLIQTSVTADERYEKYADEFSTNLLPYRGALLAANEGTPDTNSTEFMIVTADADFLQGLSDLVNYKKITLSEYLNKTYGSNINESGLISYMVYGGAPWLYGRHTVFGQVFDGFDVLDRITKTDVNNDFIPLEDVIIEEVVKIK